ncbi:Hypothetical_protein [Hexamita inflata]|uniref:Hypothetical_protein n=1 Tax=Hexamita inflata TaxID=28002 RepID=A0AA86U366_9EUKA|nr:Hypothetical protein HINF_LOCUS16983 [Hexamita inflata]
MQRKKPQGPLQMQSIIRSNTNQGINPATGNNADRSNVETAFIRQSSLHSEYHQYWLSTNYGYSKLTKHFYADCYVTYGCSCICSTVYPGLQTVIILNCKMNPTNIENYKGANPQIHIETIDESCRTFAAAERAAGRSVTELTIKVLCEQLKIIQIPKEKTELINGFVQRRGIQNEDVLGAMCANGLDYVDFAQKKGISDEQVILMLAKQNLDFSAFAQKKGMNNDQVLIVLAKNNVDCSKFLKQKGLTNTQVLLQLMKSGTDISSFVAQQKISSQQILDIISQSDLQIEEKIKLLQSYSKVELKNEHSKFNSTLIKREYEIVNERIIEFVNNRTHELELQLSFKQAMHDQWRDNCYATAAENQLLKDRIFELEQQLIDEQSKNAQTLDQKAQTQSQELTESKLEIESMKIQYAKDLQEQYAKYQTEIAKLQKDIQSDKDNQQQLDNLKNTQHVYEQQIDVNDTIANQLQQECNILKQQLIDEKQDHDAQYIKLCEIMTEQQQRKTQRINDLQKYCGVRANFDFNKCLCNNCA